MLVCKLKGKPCPRDIMRKVKAAEVARDGVEKVRERRRKEQKRNKKPPIDYFSMAVSLLSPVSGYALCFMCTSYKRFDQFYEVDGAPKRHLSAKRCGPCLEQMRNEVIKLKQNHYKKNKEAVYKRSKKWRAENINLVRESARIRRAKILADPILGPAFKKKISAMIRSEKHKSYMRNKNKVNVHHRLAT